MLAISGKTRVEMVAAGAPRWEKYSAETIEVRKMTFGYRRKILASDNANEPKSRSHS